METFCADSDDVSVGGATTLTSSWMEQAPSIHLSCAQPSVGTCSCHLRARHGVQILAEINVALRDVLDRSVAESAGFCTSETWQEGNSEYILQSILGTFHTGQANTLVIIVGTDNADSTTRRTTLCGCGRRTLCCSGEKYRGIWETATTTLRRNGNVQHQQC